MKWQSCRIYANIIFAYVSRPDRDGFWINVKRHENDHDLCIFMLSACVCVCVFDWNVRRRRSDCKWKTTSDERRRLRIKEKKKIQKKKKKKRTERQNSLPCRVLFFSPDRRSRTDTNTNQYICQPNQKYIRIASAREHSRTDEYIYIFIDEPHWIC